MGPKTQDTRDRLLDAAGAVFAEHGYHHATVAEICDRAGANIAAVNYYFRSKENLYVEAWREAFRRSVRAHPPDGGVPASAPPEDRLRGRIRALVQRVADPGSIEFEIIHKELANPTGLLSAPMSEAIEPIRRGMSGVIRELLGPDAPGEAVRLCEMSVLTPCIHFVMRDRLRRSLPEGTDLPGPPPLDVDLATIVDHIYGFSLAGLREVRRRVENPAPSETE
ncbi:MAG: CerR family C-terminal domain-containing protein [Phycisphaerae bacterium]